MDSFNISDLFCIKDNILIGPKTGDLDEKKQNCINIGNLILKSFISNPNFVGQVDGETGEEHTFQQMREETVKCALWMRGMGVQPSNVIMICTNNQLDAYIPFLAALYIGAVVSPLDMCYNLDMIDIFVEQVNPVMLFVNEGFYNIVAKKINQMLQMFNNGLIPLIIAFNSKKEKQTTMNKYLISLEKILNFTYNPFSIENFSCTKLTDMDSIAMRLFTPGTTAFPIQVGIRHLAFVAPSDQQAPNMRKNDTALLCESLCYINGIFMTIQAILLHVKVIRIKVRFDAQIICETIEKYKVTWVFFETNLCNRLIKLCQLEEYDFSSLRTVVFGGSTNSEKIHNNLRILLPNTNILQVYSLTETGIIAYQRQPGKSGSCGYVSANVELKIVARKPLNKRCILGPGLVGEIYCMSPYMASYLKCYPEKYEGWLKTGDLGYYDKDGDIFIIDRINQIISIEDGCIKVLPSKIENLLLSHDAVLEAIVIPLPIDNNDQYPVAFIRKTPFTEVTEKEIIKFLIENTLCPIELRSVIFTRVKVWPYFSNGKINRRMLLNSIHSTTNWNIPLTDLSDFIICTLVSVTAKSGIVTYKIIKHVGLL